jgi:tetratricopeptide (TPR) repeat protein
MRLQSVRRISRALLVGLALAATRSQGAPAPAAPPPEDTGQQAKSLYLQGDRAFNLGHYEEALALFEKAYNTKPVVGLLYNVATCHRFLGNLEQARRVYRAFINQTADGKLKAVAQEKLAEVEGVLDAQAKSRVSGPSMLAPIDKPSTGVVPGELEGASREAAKPVKVAAAATGAAPESGPKPEDGARTDPPKGKPAAPDAATGARSARPVPPAQEGSSRIVFWSALGAGALAAGGGVFFGMQSKAARDQLAAGGLDRATADQKAKTLDSDAKLGNLLVIGGAALLAGAACAWFLDAP